MADGLNERLESNLRFLLTAPKESLAEWLDGASAEEMKEAESLIAMAQLRIIDRAIERVGVDEAVQVLDKIFAK